MRGRPAGKELRQGVRARLGATRQAVAPHPTTQENATMNYQLGTNGIPKELEGKLTEAKDWHNRHEALKEAIAAYGGNAQRNQEDRDAFDREAREILEDIVEIIDKTWGFA